MSWGLTVEHIFAAGIGFDIAGASLLAVGLLRSPSDIAESATYAGQASVSTATLRDRVDAEVGLFFLIGGFTVQAIGYVVKEAGASSGPTGTGPAVLFAAVAVVAIAVTFAVHRLYAPRRRVRVAKAAALSHGTDATPLGAWTVYWGLRVNRPVLDGETQGEYALRVWGIASVTDPDQPASG